MKTVQRPSAIVTPTLRIYLRRSLDGEGKQVESIATQRSVNERFSTEKGFDWVNRVEYIDEGISGDNFDRPGLNGLLRDMKRGDLLVTYSDSRIGRKARKVVNILGDLIEDQGVRVFYSSTGKEVTAGTFATDLVNMAEGAGAEGYLTALRQSTRDALHSRARDGFAAGNVPYGYTTERINPADEKSKKRIVVADAAAATVRRIFALYLDGKGPRAIAKQLNREGVASPTGKGWSATTVHYSLRRAEYRGAFTFGGITTQHPEIAILDAATASLVAERMAARATDTIATATADNARHLLTGVLKCDDCGAPMKIKTSDGKTYGSRRQYYVCGKRRDSGRCGNGKHWPKMMVEAGVMDYMRGTFFTDAEKIIREEIRAEIDRIRSATSIDAGGIRAALDAARTRKTRAMRLALDTDDTEAHGMVRDLAAEVRALETQLAAAERPSLDDIAARRIEGAALAGLARLRERIEGADVEGVRQTLRALAPTGIKLDSDGNASGEACVSSDSDASGYGTPGTHCPIRFRIAA